MRRLGCLVVVLIVLAVLLFIADQAATTYAEQQQAQQLQETLDAETVAVEFDGWPVSARLLLGSIPAARMHATEVALENGATLRELDVELTGVKVNVSDLRRNSDRLPPADEGTFSAELDEASVVSMLGIPGDVVRVRLVDGVVQLRAAGLRVDADVVAQDGDVVVQLRGPLAQLLGGAEFPIDLSTEPGSPEVEDVRIRKGVMIVSGRLDDVRR